METEKNKGGIRKMKKNIMSLALAAVLLAGSLFAGVEKASAQEKAFTGEEKVVVSVEGLTLGQGFYVEPTVYTFEELTAAAAKRGETKTAAEITAQDAVLLAIEDGGYTPNMAASFYGGFYLAGIKDADKGSVNLPDILKDKVTITANSDTELGEYDYTTTAGWLFSEHNASAPVGMGDYVLSTYGESCTVDGEEYYVIRVMFSIYNSGSDLGFEGWDSTPTEESPWGSACPALYVSADRSAAYVKYAILKAEGFFAEHTDVKADVLQKMEILDADEAQMAEVYQTLVQAENDAKKEKETTKQTEETMAGTGAEAEQKSETEAEQKTEARNQTEAAAQTTKTAGTPKTGDSQTPIFWTIIMIGAAAAGVAAARKRVCENGKNS